MVQPWQLGLAIVCAILMLAVIFGMAFIPDNTKDFGINLQPAGQAASSASSVAAARPSATAADASAVPAPTLSQRPAA